MVVLGEEQLEQRLLRGDFAALGDLLSLYQKRLFNTALRMLGNRDDAAEVTQDAMLKVVEHIHEFKGQAKISTWMTRIVMNLSVSQLRKRRLRLTTSLDAPITSGNNGRHDAPPLGAALHERGEPDPASRVQQRELHALLQTALGRLDEEFRSVLVLRDIDELDYQAIAHVLDVPVGTVKSRLFRARLALRKEMLTLCPPEKTPTTPATTPSDPTATLKETQGG